MRLLESLLRLSLDMTYAFTAHPPLALYHPRTQNPIVHGTEDKPRYHRKGAQGLRRVALRLPRHCTMPLNTCLSR